MVKWDIPEKIPPNFGALKQLRSIDLRSIVITGSNVGAILEVADKKYPHRMDRLYHENKQFRNQ